MLYLYTLITDSSLFADSYRLGLTDRRLEYIYRKRFGDAEVFGRELVASLPTEPRPEILQRIFAKLKVINLELDRDKVFYNIEIVEGMQIGLVKILVDDTNPSADQTQLGALESERDVRRKLGELIDFSQDERQPDELLRYILKNIKQLYS